MHQDPPAPWDRMYWDAPDPMVPMERDPFSSFVVNEAMMENLRTLGAPEEELKSQRDLLDRQYAQWRDLLGERWRHLDPSRRGQHTYLRQVLPELLFWPSGAALGPRRVP